MTMAIYIPADIRQPVQQVEPQNGYNFSLQELYRYVGSPIAILNLADGRLLVCNDEAKLVDEPVKNVRAGEFVVFLTAGEIRAQMEALRQQFGAGAVIFGGELPEDDDAPADYVAGDVLI